MVEKLKSVSTYIVLVVVVGIFSALITNYAVDLSHNDYAVLSDSSEEYITQITGGDKKLGFNSSIYEEDIGKVTVLGGTDNKKDFSLDFSFGDKTGNKLQKSVYIALNIPEFLFKDVFRLTSIDWVVDLLDWFYRIMIFVAVGLWIRYGR